MDKEQFYPTPPELIAKMLEGVNFHKTILEPHAGTGNIIHAYASKGEKCTAFDENTKNYDFRYKKKNLLFCEINAQLSHYVERFATRIAYNFFDLIPGEYFPDYIIMNPPFADGVKHFLHAWKIANESEIICILNAETLRNPYTAERKLLLKIIEDNNGSIEYITGAFSEADRKTQVEIALIKVKKPKRKSILDLDSLILSSQEYKYQSQTSQQTELENGDQFQDMEDEYKLCVNLIGELCGLLERIDNMIITNKDRYESGFIKWLSAALEVSQNGRKEIQNIVIGMLRSYSWKKVLDNHKFKQHMNTTTEKEFNAFIKGQGNMPFNKANIIAVLESLIMNKTKIDNTTIGNAFDLCTAYYKENRVHPEGWKTNDKFLVGRKVILPMLYTSKDYMGNIPHFNAYSRNKMRDIEKALDLIVGKQYKHFGICDLIDLDLSFIMDHNTTANDWSRKRSSRYFYFRCYKKGTIHLEFKSDKLYRLLNYLACKDKNWIPENTKEKEFYTQHSDVFGKLESNFVEYKQEAPQALEYFA